MRYEPGVQTGMSRSTLDEASCCRRSNSTSSRCVHGFDMATVNEICGGSGRCCAAVWGDTKQNKQANRNIFNPIRALYICGSFGNIVNDADLTTNRRQAHKLIPHLGTRRILCFS